MLEVVFCCTCDHSGVICVSRRDWLARTVSHTCPRCQRRLDQGQHFELLDRALQRERIRIVYKTGPLSGCERARLREIHAALGNAPAGNMPREMMDLVLKRGSVVLGMIRDEMIAEAVQKTEQEERSILWVEKPAGLTPVYVDQ